MRCSITAVRHATAVCVVAVTVPFSCSGPPPMDAAADHVDPVNDPAGDSPLPVDVAAATPVTHRLTLDDLRAVELPDSAERWIRGERLIDGVKGGWVTGAVSPENRVVIETDGLEQVVLDLSRVPADWNRRVILRIDGHTSELTRAHFPTLRLRRSPTGGWLAVSK
ncbi:MAG: hypothetical protein HOP29_15840 [Phycisphaerales bacterium]|nr:hypothetical protein [Phycisphaerales bacterium]